MPTPTAIVFRPGRRSHRGRPGRRGNRAVSGSTLRGAARHLGRRRRRPRPRFRLPGAACARRARAASARASALATSSSASASETGAAAPESTAERDCGSSGSVTSAGSSQWSASGPSGSCTEKQLITSAWAQSAVIGSCLRGSYMRKCPLVRERGGVAFGWPGADGRICVQVIFSNQENFLFRCGKVIGCDSSWHWLPRCSAPVCWPRRRPSPGRLSATTPPAPRASCRIRF